MPSSLPSSTTTTPRSRMSRQQMRVARRSAVRLGGYLATGLGASVLGTATTEAAVVNLNLGPTGFNLQGINAGVTAGTYQLVFNFPFAGPDMSVYNGYNTTFGFGVGPGGGLGIAASAPQRPTNFGPSTTVGNTATFDTSPYTSVFRRGPSVSPDFGANSYLGFRATSGSNSYYGYMEVTWSATADQFELLSAAYESTPNTPIVTPAAVPEPSAIAAAGVAALALGAGAIRKARRCRKAEAAG